MSRVRADQYTNNAGTGSPLFTHGVRVTGVATATSFDGDLTGNVTGNVTGTTASFSGNVSVGGTLTYEDVTNVDSVGIVTARNGIRVGAGESIGPVSGTITYYGDGSQLTGIASTDNINAGSLTVTGISTFNGVAIGNTDPNLYHANSDALVIARGRTNDGITIDCSNQGGIFFSNGSNGAVDINGQLIYYHTPNDESMRMLVDGGERMRINDDSIVSTVPFSDSIGPLRSLGINSQSGAYTLVAGDAGKAVTQSTNSAAITVPNSVFSAGDMVTIINNTGTNINITQGTGVTMYNTADAATGTRTLVQRGAATLLFTSASVAYISGSGLN